MDNLNYLGLLNDKNSFTREDLRNAMHFSGSQISEASFKAKLQVLLRSKIIARVGRNAYCVPEDGVNMYHHEYSELAESVAKKITEEHPYLDFTVLEIVQLNEFVNHQFAHNIVFVSVEGDLCGFIFDALKRSYPGKVLVAPTTSIFHQYWYDDMVVIVKLITEAPKHNTYPWSTRLEKLLVDIITDPLIMDSVSESEFPNIYAEAFRKYVIDESCLFRYAKRRGAENDILQLIRHRTDIQLRTREL